MSLFRQEHRALQHKYWSGHTDKANCLVDFFFWFKSCMRGERKLNLCPYLQASVNGCKLSCKENNNMAIDWKCKTRHTNTNTSIIL